MQTTTKIVKSLGVANNGAHHWWLQRLSAIALIPLFVWFVTKSLCVFSANSEEVEFFNSSLSAIFFILLLIVALFHSTLGVKVIIEDYVHKECKKFFLIIFTNLFAWLTAILLVFTLVNL